MGGDQKYHARPRHIYGLFFGKALYVGQTVDLARRRKEHQRAWDQSFRFVKLDTVRGTFAAAEVAEQAWRCLGSQQGYAILAHAGNMQVRVNPHRRRDRFVQAYMKRCRWPKKLRRWHAWWAYGFATAVGLGVLALAWHGGEAAWQQIALRWASHP